MNCPVYACAGQAPAGSFCTDCWVRLPLRLSQRLTRGYGIGPASRSGTSEQAANEVFKECRDFLNKNALHASLVNGNTVLFSCQDFLASHLLVPFEMHRYIPRDRFGIEELAEQIGPVIGVNQLQWLVWCWGIFRLSGVNEQTKVKNHLAQPNRHQNAFQFSGCVTHGFRQPHTGSNIGAESIHAVAVRAVRIGWTSLDLRAPVEGILRSMAPRVAVDGLGPWKAAIYDALEQVR